MIGRPAAFVGGMIAAGALAGVLAATVLPHATGPAISWTLASPALASDATRVEIRMDSWPACHPYDEMTGDTANSSWLVTAVDYSSTSVTITVHQSSSFDASTCPGRYDFWGLPVVVNLREPLNGRTVLDGSTSPPGRP